MKRKISVIGIVLILVINVVTISLGFSINMNLDKTKNININDVVILTLDLKEPIIGASFKMNYDSNNLELVGSETTNLSISENNGKIACVYFDMAKTGTKSLKIKFKTTKNLENTKLNFELEETKLIALDGEKSYSQEELEGIKKVITIEKATTNSGNNNSSNTTNNIKDNTSNTNNNVNNSSNNGTSQKVENTTNNTKNDIKKNVTNISTISKEDNTKSTSTIPHTGINSYMLFIPIGLFSLLSIYFMIKMKSMSKI